jgi:hydroxypyruvate reductase
MPDLKHLALQIFHETLAAIDISATMQRKVWREGKLLCGGAFSVDLSRFERLRVVAIGKAAHAMVDGLTVVLGQDSGLEGVVAAPVAPAEEIPAVKYFVAGHPIPNEGSWRAAEAILELLRDADEKTLVFFLLSGGGSALAELSLDPSLTLGDVQELHQTLVTCGASIEEINTIRKHISAVKGGRLAVAARDATKITIAVSDVPAGRESALASGPTLADPTTVRDFERIVAAYHLKDKFPIPLQHWLAQGRMPETPKCGDAAFLNAHFLLLLGMDDLFHPAHHAAEAQGFIACCDNTTDDWPVEEAAEYLLEQLLELRRSNQGLRVALIADGEVSSPVTGKGVGGRNSAFVLACVKKIAGKNIAVLSAGTDGIDGNSPAAGAVADGETFYRAQQAGLNPRHMFRTSDAYIFFARLGDAIVSGPTGNNLRDLRILIAEP